MQLEVTVQQPVSQSVSQTDRQTDSQTDRQTDRQTDSQTDRQTVSQSDRQPVPAAGLRQTVISRLAAVTLLSGHSWLTSTHSSVVTLRRL